MFDRIDEWMLGNLHEYAGKSLKHVAKGELPLGEADKAKQEEATKAAAPLLDKLKGLLGDRVEDVRVSARLTDSPRAWPCPNGRWPRTWRTCCARQARTCRSTSRLRTSIPRTPSPNS